MVGIEDDIPQLWFNSLYSSSVTAFSARSYCFLVLEQMPWLKSFTILNSSLKIEAYFLF